MKLPTFTILVALAGYLISPDGLAAPPDAVGGAICHPNFEFEGQRHYAGTAFILDWNGPNAKTLLVSAHHLFGRMGGLSTDIAWSDVSSKVIDLRCVQVLGHETWRTVGALTIPGAEPLGNHVERDLSAFDFDPSVQAHFALHLELAATAPKPGDPVWLVAQANGAPADQLLHRATVTYSEDGMLQYRLGDPELELRATSGSPVVNNDGNVVGVHLGHTTANGVTIGTADSLRTIRALLQSARR